MSDNSIDGFYMAYLSGPNGNGIMMLVILNGTIVGSDPFAVIVDGTYCLATDKLHYEAKLVVTAPPDTLLVHGVNTGADGLSYEMNVALPLDPAAQDYITIETPLGKLNVRFKKLREIKNV